MQQTLDLLRKDEFLVVPPWLLLITAMTGIPAGFY